MCSSLSLPIKENSRLKLNMQLYLRKGKEEKGGSFLNFLLFVLQDEREESLLIYPV